MVTGPPNFSAPVAMSSACSLWRKTQLPFSVSRVRASGESVLLGRLVAGVGRCTAAIPARQHTSSGTRAGTETRSFMCFQTPADGHLFPTVGAGTWRLPWLVRGGGLLLRLRFLFPFAFGFRFRHGVGGADGHLSVWILFGEVDVLGAEGNADQAGRDVAEEREGLERRGEPVEKWG